MRILKIAVVAAAAEALIGARLGPALADPPSGVTPALTSVVGVGSNATALVMDAIADNHDAQKPAPAVKLYSWDAISPVTSHKRSSAFADHRRLSRHDQQPVRVGPRQQHVQHRRVQRMSNVGTASDPRIAAGPITTFFGPNGVVCKDTQHIDSYGFLPLESMCGQPNSHRSPRPAIRLAACSNTVNLTQPI
jgi:hypothetical protein